MSKNKPEIIKQDKSSVNVFTIIKTSSVEIIKFLLNPRRNLLFVEPTTAKVCRHAGMFVEY